MALAAVYCMLAYRVVFVLRIGPTAVVVDDQRGWGVHTGDLLALPVSLVALVCVALAMSWAHRAGAPAPPLEVRPRPLHPEALAGRRPRPERMRRPTAAAA